MYTTINGSRTEWWHDVIHNMYRCKMFDAMSMPPSTYRAVTCCNITSRPQLRARPCTRHLGTTWQPMSLSWRAGQHCQAAQFLLFVDFNNQAKQSFQYIVPSISFGNSCKWWYYEAGLICCFRAFPDWVSSLYYYDVLCEMFWWWRSMSESKSDIKHL